MNCWHCGTELIWGGDHDLEENDGKNMGIGAYDMVTNLSCPNCSAFVEVYRANLDHPDHKNESKPKEPSISPDASWHDDALDRVDPKILES